MCTLPPILAPKHRSKNRRQPKHGLGLIRKSGCANVHSTPRIISPDVYFLACRFCLTSSIVIQEVSCGCHYPLPEASENRIYKCQFHVERSETSLVYLRSRSIQIDRASSLRSE